MHVHTLPVDVQWSEKHTHIPPSQVFPKWGKEVSPWQEGGERKMMAVCLLSESFVEMRATKKTTSKDNNTDTQTKKKKKNS